MAKLIYDVSVADAIDADDKIGLLNAVHNYDNFVDFVANADDNDVAVADDVDNDDDDDNVKMNN